MRDVNPSDLSAFLAIARQRSLRKAATGLGVTPSALSHALRTLEDRLGLRLLNRTTRSVSLTEAGQALYDRVTPAFRDIDDALDDLNNFRGTPVGTLRLNCGRNSTQMVLLPTVTRFLAEHPGVNVEIFVDNALGDIVSGGFDAGVRFGHTLQQDMISLPIGPRQRSAVVASPAFFERHPMPTHPQNLKDLPCIRHRFDSGLHYAWEFERGGTRLTVEVSGPLTLGDRALMVEAALDGVGIAYAFEIQVEALVTQGRFVRVLEDWCPYYEGFHLYYPSRRQVPAPLRAFIDFVRAER
jgi:DNA-binding transcriptional LysR family regulator